MNKFLLPIFFAVILLSGCATASNAPAPVSSQIQQNIPATTQAATATPTLALVFPIATQAITPTAAPVSENSTADRCDNPYYPIVNGATWVYDLGDSGQANYTMNASKGGDFTIIVSSENSTFYIEGQCTEDGIILVNRGQDLQYQGEAGSSTVSSDTNDGITLPNDIQLGDDWTQTYTLSIKAGDTSMESTVETSYKAVAYESVTVPAGTFQALKIEQSGTMTLNGQVIPSKGTTWYAEGIGPVKSENGVGGTIDAVAQLVSYNIP